MVDKVSLDEALKKANDYMASEITKEGLYYEFTKDAWCILPENICFTQCCTKADTYAKGATTADVQVNIKGNGTSSGILTFIRSDEVHADRSEGTLP